MLEQTWEIGEEDAENVASTPSNSECGIAALWLVHAEEWFFRGSRAQQKRMEVLSYPEKLQALKRKQQKK